STTTARKAVRISFRFLVIQPLCSPRPLTLCLPLHSRCWAILTVHHTPLIASAGCRAFSPGRSLLFRACEARSRSARLSSQFRAAVLWPYRLAQPTARPVLLVLAYSPPSFEPNI